MSEAIIEPIEQFGLSKKDRPKALFSRIGIVGCGTTGQGIARVISTYGIEVVFLELCEEKIQEAYAGIEQELDDMINHWGMTASEKRAIMSRIHGVTKYDGFEDCDLVIEAILSNVREYSVDVRKGIFKNVENHVSPHAIICTNSSTLVVTELASELKYRDRCVSLHFSTASADIPIAQVARTLYTSDEAFENVKKFLKLVGKKMIAVEESPGLISPRLAVALINEACELLMEGVANMEDIDYTMRTGFGLRLGPFELADKIGLDRIVRWMHNLYDEFGDKKYKASPIIKRLVRAHHFGRKAAEGFYKYDDQGNKISKTIYKNI